jgi:hypothetical protein
MKPTESSTKTITKTKNSNSNTNNYPLLLIVNMIASKISPSKTKEYLSSKAILISPHNKAMALDDSYPNTFNKQSSSHKSNCSSEVPS